MEITLFIKCVNNEFTVKMNWRAFYLTGHPLTSREKIVLIFRSYIIIGLHLNDSDYMAKEKKSSDFIRNKSLP